MRITLAAPLLLLAACGQQEAAPDALAETPIPVEPDGGIGDGAGPPDAIIPAQFHGTWDAAAGNCDPASDLRVEIGSETIAFHESVGSVNAVTGQDNRAMVGLTMEGEGQVWATRFQLMLNGDRLSIEDADLQDADDAPLRVRCPD